MANAFFKILFKNCFLIEIYNLQFFHGLNDVLSVKKTTKSELNPYDTPIVYTIGFNEIVSSKRIKLFGIEHRKCKFTDEFSSNQSYPLGEYTQNFCLIECHTKMAIKLCGCQPFFYKIGD